MQSSQAYSQIAMQPCGESGGEITPSAAHNCLQIPGFSQEQSVGIRGFMTAFQIAMNQSFDQHFGSVQQPNPTPPPTQPISLAKKKRNQKTRNQKKKAQAQRVASQDQEVKHSYGQEVEHSVQIIVEKVPSKHVVLKHIVPWDWATLWHAVIPYVGMTSLNGMIRFKVIWRPRMGVG